MFKIGRKMWKFKHFQLKLQSFAIKVTHNFVGQDLAKNSKLAKKYQIFVKMRNLVFFVSIFLKFGNGYTLSDRKSSKFHNRKNW